MKQKTGILDERQPSFSLFHHPLPAQSMVKKQQLKPHSSDYKSPAPTKKHHSQQPTQTKLSSFQFTYKQKQSLQVPTQTQIATTILTPIPTAISTSLQPTYTKLQPTHTKISFIMTQIPQQQKNLIYEQYLNPQILIICKSCRKQISEFTKILIQWNIYCVQCGIRNWQNSYQIIPAPGNVGFKQLQKGTGGYQPWSFYQWHLLIEGIKMFGVESFQLIQHHNNCKQINRTLDDITKHHAMLFCKAKMYSQQTNSNININKGEGKHMIFPTAYDQFINYRISGYIQQENTINQQNSLQIFKNMSVRKQNFLKAVGYDPFRDQFEHTFYGRYQIIFGNSAAQLLQKYPSIYQAYEHELKMKQKKEKILKEYDIDAVDEEFAKLEEEGLKKDNAQQTVEIIQLEKPEQTRQLNQLKNNEYFYENNQSKQKQHLIDNEPIEPNQHNKYDQNIVLLATANLSEQLPSIAQQDLLTDQQCQDLADYVKSKYKLYLEKDNEKLELYIQQIRWTQQRIYLQEQTEKWITGAKDICIKSGNIPENQLETFVLPRNILEKCPYYEQIQLCNQKYRELKKKLKGNNLNRKNDQLIPK